MGALFASEWGAPAARSRWEKVYLRAAVIFRELIHKMEIDGALTRSCSIAVLHFNF